jgi:hypothetical protein
MYVLGTYASEGTGALERSRKGDPALARVHNVKLAIVVNSKAILFREGVEGLGRKARK